MCLLFILKKAVDYKKKSQEGQGTVGRGGPPYQLPHRKIWICKEVLCLQERFVFARRICACKHHAGDMEHKTQPVTMKKHYSPCRDISELSAVLAGHLSSWPRDLG